MEKVAGGNWNAENLLWLAGIYQPKKNIEENTIPAALKRYLEEYTHIEKVVLQLGYSYTSIVCIFCFGVANQTMRERMLVAVGKPIGSVFALTTGTVVNLVLDPILTFGYLGAPALGMRARRLQR